MHHMAKLSRVLAALAVMTVSSEAAADEGYRGPVLVSDLVGGVALLWAIGLAAAWVPARRAARVSPAVATRTV